LDLGLDLQNAFILMDSLRNINLLEELDPILSSFQQLKKLSELLEEIGVEPDPQAAEIQEKLSSLLKRMSEDPLLSSKVLSPRIVREMIKKRYLSKFEHLSSRARQIKEELIELASIWVKEAFLLLKYTIASKMVELADKLEEKELSRLKVLTRRVKRAEESLHTLDPEEAISEFRQLVKRLKIKVEEKRRKEAFESIRKLGFRLREIKALTYSGDVSEQLKRKAKEIEVSLLILQSILGRFSVLYNGASVKISHLEKETSELEEMVRKVSIMLKDKEKLERDLEELRKEFEGSWLLKLVDWLEKRLPALLESESNELKAFKDLVGFLCENKSELLDRDEPPNLKDILERCEKGTTETLLFLLKGDRLSYPLQ